MTDPEPGKHVFAIIPVSSEVLADAEASRDGFQRWINATPEERLGWIREAEARRAAERRAATEPTPLTLDALLDKLGFSDEYAEHLVQPYCYCGDSNDGWDVCQHAHDLGLTP